MGERVFADLKKPELRSWLIERLVSVFRHSDGAVEVGGGDV